MSDINPEIDAQLDTLADLCCSVLQGTEASVGDRSEALLKSLLMSGYVRKAGPNLSAEIESRAKSKCRDLAMHRGGELAAITRHLQEKFDKLVRWESDRPQEHTPPKAANISSATDA